MIYGIAADIVVMLHFGFVAFVVLGGLLAFRFPWIPWIHVPAALWGAGIEAVGGVCPLTNVETWLRRRAGQEGYAESFVEHYLVPVLYPAGLTRTLQLVLALFVVVVNVAIYALLWRRRR